VIADPVQGQPKETSQKLTKGLSQQCVFTVMCYFLAKEKPFSTLSKTIKTLRLPDAIFAKYM
jgi:hypothetical protein